MYASYNNNKKNTHPIAQKKAKAKKIKKEIKKKKGTKRINIIKLIKGSAQ